MGNKILTKATIVPRYNRAWIIEYRLQSNQFNHNNVMVFVAGWDWLVFSNSFFVFCCFILANAVAEISDATSSLNSVVYELVHVALMLKVAT